MTAYHGTTYDKAESIKAKGLISVAGIVYVSLDLEIAEQYAFLRAHQTLVACIVTIELPDTWQLTPDPNTDDDRDAWVSKPIPATCIASIDKLGGYQ